MNGFIDPAGNFYECGWGKHYELGFELIANSYKPLIGPVEAHLKAEQETHHKDVITYLVTEKHYVAFRKWPNHTETQVLICKANAAQQATLRSIKQKNRKEKFKTQFCYAG